MARLPQQFLDNLISKVDLVEIVDRHVPLKRAGKDYKACCPFHRERTPSFTVSPTKQFYYCFGCGAGGTAIDFLMENNGLGFREAVAELADLAGIPVPEDGSPDDRLAPGTYDALDRAQQAFRAQIRRSKAAIEYLGRRGVDRRTADAFGIGYAPERWEFLRKELDDLGDETLERAGLLIRNEESGRVYDRFRNRITFPIRDVRGRVIAFGARALGEDKPKYLNSPETPVFHKGRELYGLFEARKTGKALGRLVVVEGYMDVVMLHQNGVREAVATLGTSTSAEHLDRMFRLVNEVVFCFDGDRAGREAAWRALENALSVMHGDRKARFLFLPEGEDPDSLVQKEGADAFRARLDKAVPLTEYYIERLSDRLDLSVTDDRAQLVERAREHLGRIPVGAFRLLLVERLAKVAGLPADKIEGLAEAPDPAPPAGSAPRTGRRGDTPVRRALVLLLHDPSVALEVEEPERLRDNPVPGADVLRDVIGTVRSRPGINTAGIVEHYRSEETGEHLMKLAQHEPDVPDEGIAPEFVELVEHVVRQKSERRLDTLIEKASSEGLTPGEKAEMRELVAARRSVPARLSPEDREPAPI